MCPLGEHVISVANRRESTQSSFQFYFSKPILAELYLSTRPVQKNLQLARLCSDDGSDGPAERDNPEFAFGVFNSPSTSRDTPF